MNSTPLVLIVEDNARNMTLVRDILSYAGYRTLEASDGEQGVALAHSHRPDLILMDIQLPGIDGVEALAQLRADPSTAQIPVAAFTAFAMNDDRERFLHAGFQGYIEKPLSVQELPSQVQALLGTRPAGASG